MLDIKVIRQNPEKVKEGIRKKNVAVDIDKILELDGRRRELLQEVENLRAEHNKVNTEIAKTEDEELKAKEIEKMKNLKEDLSRKEKDLEVVEKNFKELILAVPNLPQDDVPGGKDERENKVLREVGRKPKFDFKPKDYLELGESLDLIDTKRAAKVSGTRFGYIKKEAVLLEFALINLALNILTNEGFIPIVPPVLLKPESLRGMGYEDLIQGEEAYYIEKDKLYLIGTAEQSIGPMHQGEIFQEDDLPKRYVGFSTCFRREAGSYGKDTKGILRVHQFDKVEMFSFCKPEDSKKEHEFFLSLEEKLMQELKIPYRVVEMCTGDLGYPAAAKYDIEAWIPGQPSSTGSGQGEYRETHSTSNTTDYQARRLNIRYKPTPRQVRQAHCKQAQGKQTTEFVHTINGTAFAIGRMLIAIIENYQQKDGSIQVPEVLQKYVGFKAIK